VPNAIKFGTIIYADLDDGNGKIEPHYAIVTDRQEAIDQGKDLAVIGISTSCLGPLQDGWFRMDSHPGGHPRTGLSEACVAKANWRDVVPQNKIIRVAGRINRGLAEQIAEYIKNHP
jgi:hypothetical protein